MAKGIATPAPEGGYQITYGSGPPDIVRRAGAATSPVTDTMRSMLPPVDGQVAEFFVPVSVPDTITDPDERAKALKDEARKASNRLSGIARRVAKADPTANFALRTKTQDGRLGVVVYRIAPAPPAKKAK